MIPLSYNGEYAGFLNLRRGFDSCQRDHTLHRHGMNHFHIIELGEQHRPLIRDHLLRLSNEDRQLRFFTHLTDFMITRYAMELISFKRDIVFGEILDGKLIGMASISNIEGVGCEAAFSIDEDQRGTGLARELMRAIINRCRSLGVNKICMSCLRRNIKMQALARSFGLDMKITFDEAYAELEFTA
jgi:RimJ/RimL family protein N-acetyltransferase